MWRLKERQVDEYNFAAYKTSLLVAWLGGKYLGQGSLEECEQLIKSELCKHRPSGCDYIGEIRTGRGPIIIRNIYSWEDRKHAGDSLVR